jgi:hypothetical protein
MMRTPGVSAPDSGSTLSPLSRPRGPRLFRLRSDHPNRAIESPCDPSWKVSPGRRAATQAFRDAHILPGVTALGRWDRYLEILQRDRASVTSKEYSHFHSKAIVQSQLLNLEQERNWSRWANAWSKASWRTPAAWPGILSCPSKSLRSGRRFGASKPMKVSPDIVISFTESLYCK